MQFTNAVSLKEISHGKKYLEERKDTKAEKCLKKVIEKNPSNDDAWLYLGIARRRLKKIDGAIRCFKKATKLNDSMEEAWGLLTITLIDDGKITSAKKIIQEALRLNPRNERIRFLNKNLIHIYRKFGPFF